MSTKTIDFLMKMMVGAVAASFVSGSAAGGFFLLGAPSAATDAFTIVALFLLAIFFATAIFVLLLMVWEEDQ